YMANPELPVEVRRQRTEWLSRSVRLPSGTDVQTVQAGGVAPEWVVPPGADPDAVLLYLHGGGYARARRPHTGRSSPVWRRPPAPLASPLYADLRGLPPILFQLGEDELLLGDALRLVERALAAGVLATVEVWPGLWHIFQTQGTFPEIARGNAASGAFPPASF